MRSSSRRHLARPQRPRACWRALLLAPLLLSACGEDAPPRELPFTCDRYGGDLDGDGHCAEGASPDCDDEDPGVGPAADGAECPLSP